MKNSFVPGARATCLIVGSVVFALLAGAPAHALVVDWSNSFLLQGSGVENPLVRVGFDPQPEPPGHVTTLLLGAPTNPILQTVAGPDPVPFRIIFALGPDPTPFGPDPSPFTISAPGTPNAAGHFGFAIRRGAVTGPLAFTAMLDMTTSSGGVPSSASWVGFDPQPEPPGLPAGAGAVGFDFSFTSLSTATLAFSIVDAGGQALAFSAVPEPASLLLLAAGLAALGAAARLRRRVGGTRTDLRKPQQTSGSDSIFRRIHTDIRKAPRASRSIQDRCQTSTPGLMSCAI